MAATSEYFNITMLGKTSMNGYEKLNRKILKFWDLSACVLEIKLKIRLMIYDCQNLQKMQ